MDDLTRADARLRLEVADTAEIARRAGSRDPDLIAREDIEDGLGTSPLILDGFRRRPRYFDGRFLTGADLTRDQDYIRQRQNDLALASGTGVVAGLRVSNGNEVRGETLVIEPGHGITADGQLVMIQTQREIPLQDIPESRRLNATLGLRSEPRAPLSRRSGLFIVALRPVEFTANPIAAYPTRISGARHIEDGDIIEATAITLIPYPGGDVGTLEDARRQVAKEIFLGEPKGFEEDALPLAMVALDRGALAWIDLPMVRRETGADTPLQVSLGAKPRALSEAFLLQYQAHLADVVATRTRTGLPLAFTAAQSFAALPPAGPLPAAAIVPDPDGFRQLWFPPSVDVELSFAPADEIAALIEESQALPAIDLADEAEVLDATSIIVIAPVTRPRLQRFAFALDRLQIAVEGGAGPAQRSTPAADLAALLARRRNLRLPAVRPGSVRTEAEEAQLRAWQAAWAEAIGALPDSGTAAPMLWYIRRRTVAQHSAIVGVTVPITGDDEADDDIVRGRIDDLGLRSRVDTLTERATPAAVSTMTRFLATERVASSDTLLTAGVRALELEVSGERPVVLEEDLRERVVTDRVREITRREELERLRNRTGALTRNTNGRLSEAIVVDVMADFTGTDLGRGLRMMDKARGSGMSTEDAVWLGDTGLALAVDRTAFQLSDGGNEVDPVTRFTETIDEVVAARDADKLQSVMNEFRQ